MSFASYSADEALQPAAPTIFAEQADAAEQLPSGGESPAPEGDAPPPAPVNEAPTALEAELSPIAENSAGHIIVGRLTTADPDGQDSHSYEIVGGHPLFEIDGDTITLKPGAQLDYETQNSYDLEIRSTDGAGNSIVKTVTVNVTDVNEAPTELQAALSPAAENAQAGTIVGQLATLDPDHGDSHSYEIVGGHPLFEIDGDTITLKPGAQLDYETQNSYDLEIRSHRRRRQQHRQNRHRQCN